jgi:hypothetical protein
VAAVAVALLVTVFALLRPDATPADLVAPAPSPTLEATSPPPTVTPTPTPTKVPGPVPAAGPLKPAPRRTTPKPAGTTKPAPAPAPGGFPSAGSTGWVHTGVTLSPLPCTSGQELNISRAGTVIDGRDINCNVLVTANNVTIKRSRVTAGDPFAIRQLDDISGLVVTDTQIIGKPGCAVGVGFSNWTGTRLDISGCADGVHTEGNVTIADSWIHDLLHADGSHNDGIQATGSSNVTIRHNRIENPKEQTSAILVGGENGAPSNWLIEANYLDGGNYTIYLDPNGSNRVIRNNVFSRRYVYGPVNLAGQVTFSGNTFDGGGAVTA